MAETNPTYGSMVEGLLYHSNFLIRDVSDNFHGCESLSLALTGRDIYGIVPTGSTKTSGFVFPVLEKLFLNRPNNKPARALVLSPPGVSSRHVLSMILELEPSVTDLRMCSMLGGLSQVQEELMSLPDIVRANPHMLDELLSSKSLRLDELEVLIIIDAGQLIETGCERQIRELVNLCPNRRQTMLFSSTANGCVEELSKDCLRDPVVVDLSTLPAALTEVVVPVQGTSKREREAILLMLCSESYMSRVLVYSGTKKAARRLNNIFRLVGLKAAEIHGDTSQVERFDALERFRKQEVDFLILPTNFAAVGVNIIGVQTVINFACPKGITGYNRRKCRVEQEARAGQDGCAVVTIVTDNDDRSPVKSIVGKAGSNLVNASVYDDLITKWFKPIEQLEEQVSLTQEVTEDAICARPEPAWFVTRNEKILMVVAFFALFFSLYVSFHY